jgi:hypothetical protein
VTAAEVAAPKSISDKIEYRAVNKHAINVLNKSTDKAAPYGTKMNIKKDDWQDKMNNKCCTPSTSSARGPAKATSQVHHHDPSKENTECYKQQTSPSTSQEPSIPKHYRAPQKFVTPSTTMHSN